ncbi:hypothetical protein [Puia sp.]|jgi:hypothetical protein|uniref:hypothetical protein n=1 Tax=Puia sp. TaxID=2045100 RepID=UPI002F41D4B0
MKLSTKLLAGLFVLTIAALLSANLSIKTNYDNTDKDDRYWGYGKILEQPFKHIKIEGGNITQMTFEQSERPSVRVLKQWPGYESRAVKAFVKADTLFIRFPRENSADNAKVKDWIKHTTLVRIFAPELVSIEGIDTDVDLLKMHQKSISIELSGNSEMEVESELSQMDSLIVIANGSSDLNFEMSPGAGANKLIRVRSADIHLNGTAKLDLGPVQIDSYKLNMADSALIRLSGFSVNKMTR